MLESQKAKLSHFFDRLKAKKRKKKIYLFECKLRKGYTYEIAKESIIFWSQYECPTKRIVSDTKYIERAETALRIKNMAFEFENET